MCTFNIAYVLSSVITYSRIFYLVYKAMIPSFRAAQKVKITVFFLKFH